MTSTRREYPSKATILLAIIVIPLGTLYAQPSASLPISYRKGVTLRALLDVSNDCVRITTDSAGTFLYYMTLGGDIYRVDPAAPEKVLLYTSNDHGVVAPQGFAVAPDGTFFVVGNITDSTDSGIIRRGRLAGKTRVWTTVATAEPYPLNIHYNHAFNAVEVSPDGKYIYVNSGSRTDHGELEHLTGALAGLREMPLTSKIFRLPADGENIILRNNLDSLTAAGYVYAYGVRNSYDLAFGPEGNLFGTENSDDRDDGEELNWIREGHHYGFPWRIGTHDTPQRRPGYKAIYDPLLNHASYAYSMGFYFDDSTYPAPPPNVTFTDPITNIGPDADKFRDSVTGTVMDASDMGLTVGTFTPHRSPLGLVFDNRHALAASMAGDGFMLSWNDSTSELLAPFNDGGSDMMQIHLEKDGSGENYTAQVTRVISGFKHPVDAAMIGNKIYVIENADTAHIWEVTLPGSSSGVSPKSVAQLSLSGGTPSPASSSVTISYEIPANEPVRLVLYDGLGRQVATLLSERQSAGEHTFRFGVSTFSSGVYYYQIYTSEGTLTKSMVVAR